MIKMIKPENMVFGTGEIEHGNGFSLAALKKYHENWIKNEKTWFNYSLPYNSKVSPTKIVRTFFKYW